MSFHFISLNFIVSTIFVHPKFANTIPAKFQQIQDLNSMINCIGLDFAAQLIWTISLALIFSKID